MAQEQTIDLKFDRDFVAVHGIAKLAQAGMDSTVEPLDGLRRQSRLKRVPGEEPEVITLPPPNRRVGIQHLQDLRRAYEDRLHDAGEEAPGDPGVFVHEYGVDLIFDRRTGYERATFAAKDPAELKILIRTLKDAAELRSDELLNFLRYEVPAAAPPGLERAVQKVSWRQDHAAVEERARGKESLGSSAAAAIDDDALAAIGPLQVFRVPYFAELGLRDIGTLEVHLDPKPAERSWHVQITRASLDAFRISRLEYLVERTREVFEGAEVGVYAGQFESHVH